MDSDLVVYVVAALGSVAVAWLVGMLLARRAKERRRAEFAVAVGLLVALYVVGAFTVNQVLA